MFTSSYHRCCLFTGPSPAQKPTSSLRSCFSRQITNTSKLLFSRQEVTNSLRSLFLRGIQEILQKPFLESDHSRRLFSRGIQEILQKLHREGDPRNPPEASSRGGSKKSSNSLFSKGMQRYITNTQPLCSRIQLYITNVIQPL